MDVEIEKFNFKDLPDRLNGLDEDQLKLIHEELSEFCIPFHFSKDIDDVMNEIFTCRLNEFDRFKKMISLDCAIKHVQALPDITVKVENVHAIIRYFLKSLFENNTTPGEIVVIECNDYHDTNVREVVIQNEGQISTYLVGSDEDFCNLLACEYRYDDIRLGCLDPLYVWLNLDNKCTLSKEYFLSLLKKVDNEIARSVIYRVVLDDNYKNLASHVMSEDGIEQCFSGLEEAVEFHVDGSEEDYFYLQVDH